MKEIMTPELAEYRARCFVTGVHRHCKSGKMEPIGGQFSDRFITHPWVRESIIEGWERELRSHLVIVARLRLMRGEQIGDIENLMPDQKWVEAAKHQAAIYRRAQGYREATYGKVSGEAFLRRMGIKPPWETPNAPMEDNQA